MSAGPGRLAGRHLLLIGAGYSARALVGLAQREGAKVSATLRDPATAAALREAGIAPLPAEGPLAPEALAGVTDILVSAPPGPEGCPGLALVAPALRGQAGGPGWIGYFSSTAVYGDCGGDWIDETRAPAPRGTDARGRLVAEEGWRGLARGIGAACDVMRIAGIYGPGRDVTAGLRAGTARAIEKPGQVFNRIHRDDIAGAALAAMLAPAGERLTNLADGHPCSSAEILRGVARMLGLPEPPAVAFDEAGLPPAMAGFYAENRRLRNDRLRALPGFALRYPDWRAGYAAIIAAQDAAAEG